MTDTNVENVGPPHTGGPTSISPVHVETGAGKARAGRHRKVAIGPSSTGRINGVRVRIRMRCIGIDSDPIYSLDQRLGPGLGHGLCIHGSLSF